MPGNADKGTFLIDGNKRIVGWVTNDFQVENSRLAAVRTISDYKSILEKLSNGIPIPYIGVMGQGTNREELEEGIPNGIYVNRAVKDGPAYQAGIQAGNDRRLKIWICCAGKSAKVQQGCIYRIRISGNNRSQVNPPGSINAASVRTEGKE